MKRAAVYARYSSDLQADRSIEDQAALCYEYSTRHNLTVVATFSDRARSGASIINRDGVLTMMDAARDNAFDVLVVEALDRLSRDQEDLAGIYKRLTHIGIDIVAVHEGRADVVQVGIRGLVGALYLQDLAKKVRRGMSGVVRDGRNAGGRAYGYSPVAGKPGELVVVPDEAEIVRRIFRDYVGGMTPREIAGVLNSLGVPAPRRLYWQASAINGSQQRGNGIIHNALYDGRIIWNRVRMVKHPDTGRRISRPNPQSEWQIASAEHLRIVPAELFARANARQKPSTPKQVRKNGRILSGLLRCGACCSGMSVKDRNGRKVKVTRIVCTRSKESRSCSNTRAYVLDHIESTVLAGLRAHLKDPRLLDYFVAVYNDEHKQLYAGQGAVRAKAECRLAEVVREHERTVNMLVKGILSEQEAATRLPVLRAERARLDAELAKTPELPKVVALKPALVARYRRDLELLDQVVRQRGPLAAEVARALRDLVTTVTVMPAPVGEQPTIRIDGYLSSLVDEGLHQRLKVSGGWSKLVVAEDRYHAAIDSPVSGRSHRQPRHHSGFALHQWRSVLALL